MEVLPEIVQNIYNLLALILPAEVASNLPLVVVAAVVIMTAIVAVVQAAKVQGWIPEGMSAKISAALSVVIPAFAAVAQAVASPELLAQADEIAAMIAVVISSGVFIWVGNTLIYLFGKAQGLLKSRS